MDKIIEATERYKSVYRVSSPIFSMLSLEKEVAYNITQCKEYVLDCFYHSLMGTGNASYKRVSQEEIHLVVGNINHNALNVIRILNMFEDVIGIPSSSLTTYNSLCFFVGNKRWLISPAMLSLYALIIRVGSYVYDNSVGLVLEQVAAAQNNDSLILNQGALYGIHHILTYGDGVFSPDVKANWTTPPDAPYNIIHCCGIQYYGSKLKNVVVK